MTSIYKEMLTKEAYPSVQSRISALYFVESERRNLWHDIEKPTPLQARVFEETGNSIELLKSLLTNMKQSRKSKNAVFFRETLNRIEESLLLLKKREQLLEESEEIRDIIDLSELPEHIRKSLLYSVSDARNTFENSTLEFPPGAFKLRKALHSLNDFLNETYKNMYFVKIAVKSQLITLGIGFFLLGLAYLAYKGAHVPFNTGGFKFIGNLLRHDPSIPFCLFTLLLGATGGTVGALMVAMRE